MINKPAKSNPLRFIDTENINESFDGNFASLQLTDYQKLAKCYLQKWQSSDVLKLQVVADEVPTDLRIVDVNGYLIATIPWTANAFIITGFPTYKIYEISYSFAALQPEAYKCIFGSAANPDRFESEGFSVMAKQENTILLKYKNSENNWSVIFDTGIEFQFRVEAIIQNFQPGNDRNTYIDQKRNVTLLDSVAYIKETLYVGGDYGVPKWVLDKINNIQQCDQVSYNGVFYQPPDGAEYESTTDPKNVYFWGSIEVNPVDNNFVRYKTTTPPTNLTFTPMQHTTQINNVAGDLNIPGVFVNKSKLEGVDVFKRTGPNFRLNIGITPNGKEIGSFMIDNPSPFDQVQYNFTGPTTVYLSGIPTTGLDADIILEWRQLDQPNVPIGGGGNVPPPVGKGAKMLWEEITAGDLAKYWDNSTGLGKTNESWRGWCWAGTNGTDLVDDIYHVGLPLVGGIPDVSLLGNVIGANEKAIAKANLPAEGIFTLSPTVNSSPGDVPDATSPVARAGSNNGAFAYELRKGSGAANLGKSSNLGDGTNFNVQPKSLQSLWVIKLTD